MRKIRTNTRTGVTIATAPVRIAAVLFALLVPLFGASVALADPAPVVLELFTSNSCSSCPPAYTLLRKLNAESPRTQGAPLIVLSEHVDYWNNLGWVDRYSDAKFTRRQSEYAHQVFGRGRVYTPQLVVNGKREMVGSRSGEVRSAINAEAGRASLPVTLKVQSSGSDAANVKVSVAGGSLPEPGTVWLALTQDDVVSHIGAGENSGRRLEEDGVVRIFKPLGTHPDHAKDSQQYQATLSLPAKVDHKKLSVVAFVQQKQSRTIVGAAKEALSPAGQTVGQR